MSDDTYESPLAARNASPQMLRIFSPRHKFSLWRRLWLELARAQHNLGLSRISAQALTQMEAHLDDVDLARAADWEKRIRHDLMAHVHTFEEAAPAAKGIIHLGATSMDIVDNADLLIMRAALQLVARRLANTVDALATFALRYKDLPTLGYTHFQPAQLTTVGKRAALWAQDFALALSNIEACIDTLPFRGLKGTTGTQASFLTLFDDNDAKVQALDAAFTTACGFTRALPLTGQTYPRIIDAQVVSALAAVAAAVHRFANDVRLLAGLKQIEEPLEEEQVGSSAMAYKRNPMRCERATGLARFVISLSTSPLQTAAEQWLERTLDDSANKRLSVPEPFLAVDGCLLIVTNVARGLVVNENVIATAITAELPFMATEEILMAAVRAGGDRQDLHERIRKHSVEAARQVKTHGRPNDLIQRLQGDPAFASLTLAQVLDPRRFVGRAPKQVEEFVHTTVEPLRRKYAAALGDAAELRV